jgi:PAS domain S-box-containing protein
VDVFAEISGWIQLGLMIIMVGLAPKIAGQFPRFRAWRICWFVFGVALLGMLESRLLVIALAYGYETQMTRFLHRFVTPLQVSIGLCLALVLLYRLLHRVDTLHRKIRLPHAAGFILDRNSIVRAWDRGAQQLWGWTPEEAIGQSIVHLITPERRQSLHVPFIDRYMQAEPDSHPTVTYALWTRWRDTSREFHTEVLVTAVPSREGTLHFQCVARELVPLN